MKPFNLEEAKAGKKMAFRSGGSVEFVAHIPNANPCCRLVFLNHQTGGVVTRYEDGRAASGPGCDGDILMLPEKKVVKMILVDIRVGDGGPAGSFSAYEDTEYNRNYCNRYNLKILKKFEIEYEVE